MVSCVWREAGKAWAGSAYIMDCQMPAVAKWLSPRRMLVIDTAMPRSLLGGWKHTKYGALLKAYLLSKLLDRAVPRLHVRREFLELLDVLPSMFDVLFSLFDRSRGERRRSDVRLSACHVQGEEGNVKPPARLHKDAQ